tara:strand:- start:913 stop:1482 length:570 start_codon:yes stop_codon:yes gene_type:complete
MDQILVENQKIKHFSKLIKQIAENKSKDAFVELFKHFAPRIKAYARKNGFSVNEADDLAQETLITVWNKANLFDGNKAAASTWIYTIGRNKRIDFLRRQKHPLPNQDDPLSGVDNNTQDIMVENEEMFSIVRSEVKKLPKEQLEVLTKSFFEGKSHAEISKDLSIPLGTVKSRIRLAVTNIRKKMKDLH